jgi:hypothetical protein
MRAHPKIYRLGRARVYFFKTQLLLFNSSFGLEAWNSRARTSHLAEEMQGERGIGGKILDARVKVHPAKFRV